MDGRSRHQLGQAEPEGPLGPPVSAVQPADLRGQPARLLPTERSAASRRPRSAPTERSSAGPPRSGAGTHLGRHAVGHAEVHAEPRARRAGFQEPLLRQGPAALPGGSCGAQRGGQPCPTRPTPAPHPAPPHLGPRVAALCSAPSPAAAAAAAPPTPAPSASASEGRSSAGRHGAVRPRDAAGTAAALPRSAPPAPSTAPRRTPPTRAAAARAPRWPLPPPPARSPPSRCRPPSPPPRGGARRGRLSPTSLLGPQLRSPAATEDGHERLPPAARPARE